MSRAGREARRLVAERQDQEAADHPGRWRDRRAERREQDAAAELAEQGYEIQPERRRNKWDWDDRPRARAGRW